MPKKPRSARRRKNATSMENNASEDGDYNGVDVDVLSEDHTIADTMSTGFQSLADDFNEFGGEDEVDDEFNGTPSTSAATSTSTGTNSSESIRHTKLLDALGHASTITTERRAIKREQCLRSLFKAITQYATFSTGRETIHSHLESSILPACITGLRMGVASPAEQYAACRVLECTSVLLGGDMDEYCELLQANDLLLRVVKGTGRAPQVRGAALRALAMAHFVCGTDDVASAWVLDLCEAVCDVRFRGEDVPPSLRATALDCWALLSTTVHGAYIAGSEELCGRRGRGVVILPLLHSCLNHVNVDLRCAAGECVALIHEARLNLGIDEGEGENASERRFRRGSWDGSDYEVLMDEVKQRVAELSIESGHHMSKKAKKEQRATFREFMVTIVEDESPSEIVAFRGGQITLTTWKEIIQLNFIRHCLQGGFQIQLMTNSTLQIIFGADGRVLNELATMSQLEKRLIMSKTSEASKSADMEMTRRRRARTNAQNFFITADGDNI